MKKLYAILIFLCTFQTMMAIVLKDGFDSSKSARLAVKNPNVAFVAKSGIYLTCEYEPHPDAMGRELKEKAFTFDNSLGGEYQGLIALGDSGGPLITKEGLVGIAHGVYGLGRGTGEAGSVDGDVETMFLSPSQYWIDIAPHLNWIRTVLAGI